jgi:prolipoprotein diacylglyceryltransferase
MHLARLAADEDPPRARSVEDVQRLAAGQRSRHVHPTQLYDFLALAALFVVLSVIFYRRKRHGMVLAWGLVLYAVQRFFQEMLRADNPRDVWGMTVSQFVCAVLLVAGLALMMVLLRLAPCCAVTSLAVDSQDARA